MEQGGKFIRYRGVFASSKEHNEWARWFEAMLLKTIYLPELVDWSSTIEEANETAVRLGKPVPVQSH